MLHIKCSLKVTITWIQLEYCKLTNFYIHNWYEKCKIDNLFRISRHDHHQHQFCIRNKLVRSIKVPWWCSPTSYQLQTFNIFTVYHKIIKKYILLSFCIILFRRMFWYMYKRKIHRSIYILFLYNIYHNTKVKIKLADKNVYAYF